MANIKELRSAVEDKLTHARAIDMTGTRAEIHAASEDVVAAKQALSEAIAAGADPCPDCGAAPHGMVQEVMVRKTLTPIYEVGCLACKDHRAQGFLPQLAVADWNAGPDEWIEPSAGPGIRGAELLSIKPEDVAELKV